MTGDQPPFGPEIAVIAAAPNMIPYATLPDGTALMSAGEASPGDDGPRTALSGLSKAVQVLRREIRFAFHDNVPKPQNGDDKPPFTNLIAFLEHRQTRFEPGSLGYGELGGMLVRAYSLQANPERPIDPIYDFPSQRIEADDLQTTPFASTERMIPIIELPADSGPFRWDHTSWPQNVNIEEGSMQLDTETVTTLMADARLETVLIRRHLGEQGGKRQIMGVTVDTVAPMTEVSFYADDTFGPDGKNDRLFGKHAVISINANEFGRLASKLFGELTGKGVPQERARSLAWEHLVNSYVRLGLLQAKTYNQMYNPVQPKRNMVARGIDNVRQLIHKQYRDATVVAFDAPDMTSR